MLRFHWTLVYFVLFRVIVLAIKKTMMMNRVHTITKKHYIPESTFIYQNALRKHMQGGGLYALWITILYVLDNKNVYMWQEKVYDPKT